MHVLIGVIVEAKDDYDAVIKARVYADSLVRRCFDYYTDFWSGSEVAERWRQNEPALRLDTEAGQRFVEQLWEKYKTHVMRAIREIREAFEKFSDDEIFADLRDESVEYRFIRSKMHEVGATHGYPVRIYVDNWGTVTESTTMEMVREKLFNDKYWVVPLDVHV
ncbi:MAG TPA: hypothetical protein EYP10_01810 [Armatimonadetes bacterium]|nr:hypothetical protein [Armatimonadota bacterium]